MPPRQPPRRSHAAPAIGRESRGTVSIARALSKMGICSRSEGEQAVREGRVRVNGRRVTDFTLRVTPERDKITIDGSAPDVADRMYIMLNKPRGQVTTRRDPRGRPTVYDNLTDPSLPFLGPVGRLDQASEGLLLFTNDTQWGNAIAAPESEVTKTYHVQIDRVPDTALLTALRSGVLTDDGESLSATRVEILRSGQRHGWLLIELDEGRNRQIRRMLEVQGAAVLRLVRVAIGVLELGALPKGAWRALTDAEVQSLGAPKAARPVSRVRSAPVSRDQRTSRE
jgi:23S rRNA pseudouridine2605 synthase